MRRCEKLDAYQGSSLDDVLFFICNLLAGIHYIGEKGFRSIFLSSKPDVAIEEDEVFIPVCLNGNSVSILGVKWLYFIHSPLAISEIHDTELTLNRVCESGFIILLPPCLVGTPSDHIFTRKTKPQDFIKRCSFVFDH